MIAHRALTPGATENAISSILKAAENGADLVELDIRLSLDRRPVVTHDAFLGRSTHGHGWVRLWPSFLLRRQDLRETDHDERLPTLREALRVIPEGIEPALHLKDRAALGPVLREIRRREHPERTWLWLERPSDVTRAVRIMPEIRCTLLRPAGCTPENRHAYMREARESGASAVSLPWGVIDADLVSLARQHNLLVFSREESSPPIANRIAIGVAGIITDDPCSVQRAIEEALPGIPAGSERAKKRPSPACRGGAFDRGIA